jgi:ABC-type sugar transport system ATPase subunit
MYSRLGFSVAAHMDPEVLLVDEVLSVGDMAFQAQCTQKMRDLLESDITIILVSHNLALISSICKRVMLLEKGKITKEDIPDEVIPYYENIIYGKREDELKTQVSDSYKVRLKQELPVEILNISMSDDRQNIKESFNFGEPIFIRMEFMAKETIVNPVFDIDILRADGVLCCSSNTKADKVKIDHIEGKGAINISLDKINLSPGIYLVKVAIFDNEMIHPYAIGRKEIFKIISKGIIGHNAIFIPKVEWQLDIKY